MRWSGYSLFWHFPPKILAAGVSVSFPALLQRYIIPLTATPSLSATTSIDDRGRGRCCYLQTSPSSLRFFLCCSRRHRITCRHHYCNKINENEKMLRPIPTPTWTTYKSFVDDDTSSQHLTTVLERTIQLHSMTIRHLKVHCVSSSMILQMFIDNE